MDSKNQIQKREIKFRAWDKETGKMHYVVNKPRNEENVDDELIIQFSCTGYSARTDKKYIGDECLMQYTNLKDKNGKEIFEGDILQIKEYFNEDLGAKLSEIGVVIFNDGWGKFEQVGYQVKITLFKDGEVWRDNVENLIKSRYDKDGNNNEKPTTCWEIIGNIYENKELLEAKND